MSYHQAQLLGGELVAGKDLSKILLTQMAQEDFPANSAKIRGQRQVAPFIENCRIKAWPASIDFAAFNPSTRDKHDVSMAVIGPAVAVLTRRPTELRQGKEHYVIHPVPKVVVKGRKAIGQLFQVIGHLTFRSSLIDMRIPTFDLSESNL